VAADLTAAARLWGQTTGRISTPQVLHEVAVDRAETLTVNIRLHAMAASTKKSAVCLSASASCTVR